MKLYNTNVHGRVLNAFNGLEDHFNNIHSNKYDYTKSIYINAKTIITIICPIHGEFNQLPTHHKNGSQCPLCAKKVKRGKQAYTTQSFIKQAVKIHKGTYDYSETVYNGSQNRLKIICKKHGAFSQRAGNHILGSGCNKCNPKGFQTTKPGLLYYLKIYDPALNITAYKIGITNHSVKHRYSSTELELITTLEEKWFTSGFDCFQKEQQILKSYNHYKYIGPDLLVTGNTELFSINLQNLSFPLL